MTPARPLVEPCPAVLGPHRCAWSAGHPADGATLFSWHLARDASGRVVAAWVDSTETREKP